MPPRNADLASIAPEILDEMAAALSAQLVAAPALVSNAKLASACLFAVNTRSVRVVDAL